MALDIGDMDDAALAGVISDIRDVLTARNTDLQGDDRPAAKSTLAHRRYALTALDHAEGRLRLCAAHPLEPVADRPRVHRVDESGRDVRLGGRPHP